MENDKAKAWLTLADADAVEQKVLDTIAKVLMDSDALNQGIMYNIVNKLCMDYNFQMRVKGLLEPMMHDAVRSALLQNFKVDHYYEQWNRTAGYRIRYGDAIIQQEQIKIGF